MRYRRISFRYTEVVTRQPVRLFGDPWGLPSRPTVARREWKPPADLYETDGAYVVRVELAGVAEEDLDITLYADALIVEGVRRCEPGGAARYHAAEIRYGPFRLEVTFPGPIDHEHVGARYDAGFLLLTVAKPEGTPS
jgi:HSP20 family protein